MSLTLFGQIKVINCVSITVLLTGSSLFQLRGGSVLQLLLKTLHLCDDGGTREMEGTREEVEEGEEGEFVTVHSSV